MSNVKKNVSKKSAEDEEVVQAEEDGRKSTSAKRAPKVATKKNEPVEMFENHSQDLAFDFAESMKKLHREKDSSAERDRVASDVKLSRRPTSRAKGKATFQFPESDLEEFRKRLIFLRQETLGQSATLRTVALEQTEDRGSEDEDGSDAFLRLQNLKQVDTQSRIVQQIDEALARINDGTYGICEVCGQLIRKPRLMNLPFVHTCMECQTAMEQPFGKA